MNGKEAGMVFTDPPYNVDYTGGTEEKLKIQNDKMADADFYKFLLESHKNMLDVVAPGGAIYVCHADSEGMNFRKAMRDAGWLLKQCIIWVKSSLVMGRQDYHWQHEPILYGWKPGAAHNWYGGRKQTTTWEIDRPSKNSEHPTKKPIELCARAIDNSSRAGEIVLDLFGGSGSTLIAAEQAGRTCYTLEIDPVYVDVIANRFIAQVGSDKDVFLLRGSERLAYSQLAKHIDLTYCACHGLMYMTKLKEVVYMFKFQMKVTGRERKEVAGLIASHFKTQAVYNGAPSFGYLIKEPTGRQWIVDKTGAIFTEGTAEDNLVEMFMALSMLEESGVAAAGQAAITIATEGHSGVTLRNLVNILAGKQRLIAKSMGTDGQPIITREMVAAINAVRLKTIDDFFESAGSQASPGLVITKDTITFRWFAATLNPLAIQAYIQLAFAVNKMALAQKHSSPMERVQENSRYHFRTWLLRLGFIGDQYSAARKLFLAGLDGNVAFRTPEQAKEAVEKRKKEYV